MVSNRERGSRGRYGPLGLCYRVTCRRPYEPNGGPCWCRKGRLGRSFASCRGRTSLAGQPQQPSCPTPAEDIQVSVTKGLICSRTRSRIARKSTSRLQLMSSLSRRRGDLAFDGEIANCQRTNSTAPASRHFPRGGLPSKSLRNGPSNSHSYSSSIVVSASASVPREMRRKSTCPAR